MGPCYTLAVKSRLGLVLLFCFSALIGCNLGKGYHDLEVDYSPFVVSNFKAIDSWVFKTRCIECHGPQKKEKDIDLSSYEKIFSGAIFPPLIIPGFPEKSSLYESIVKGRMPKGKAPLKKKELQAIYDWIKNGARKEELERPTPPGPTPEPGEPDPDTGGGGTNEPGLN